MPGAGGRTRPLLGTRARRRLFEPAPPPRPRGSAPSRSLSSLSKQGRGPRAHVVSEEVVPLGPWRREQPPDVAWRRADGGRPHSAQTDKGPPAPSATAPAVIRLHVLGASRGFHVTRDAPAGQLPTVMGGQGAAEGLKRKLLPLRSPPPVPASAWEGAPPPHTHPLARASWPASWGALAAALPSGGRRRRSCLPPARQAVRHRHRHLLQVSSKRLAPASSLAPRYHRSRRGQRVSV